MNKSNNIWMFHRVRINNNKINKIYDQRGMVHTFEEIATLIDSALEAKKEFGSLSQALSNINTIHLTFDDGYKEHLAVAKALENRYGLPFNAITFSVNVRNSFFVKKLSMDIIYQYLVEKKVDNLSNTKINKIKSRIFSTKKYIKKLNKFELDDYFLNEAELLMLSKLYSIGSHCVNHFFLDSLSSDEIHYELSESKKILESRLNTSIDVICYPEGRSNENIRILAKKSSYKFGLAISSGIGHYQIGRSIPR